jgi:mono/diheme cytochrome c family protein
MAAIGGACLVMAATACADDEPMASPAGAPVPSGAAAYAANCAGCHGADGSGGRAPAIGNGMSGAKYDEARLIEIIREGKGAMPAMRGVSPAAAAEIAAYVRNELGRPG